MPRSAWGTASRDSTKTRRSQGCGLAGAGGSLPEVIEHQGQRWASYVHREAGERQLGPSGEWPAREKILPALESTSGPAWASLPGMSPIWGVWCPNFPCGLPVTNPSGAGHGDGGLTIRSPS